MIELVGRSKINTKYFVLPLHLLKNAHKSGQSLAACDNNKFNFQEHYDFIINYSMVIKLVYFGAGGRDGKSGFLNPEWIFCIDINKY